MKDIKEFIQNCFDRVIAGNCYDLEKANQHQKKSGIFSMSVSNVVREIIRFVDTEHVGCCLHYSIFLAAIMEDFCIEARFATIPDDDGNGNRTHKHACVWFAYDGKEFIADPAKALIEKNPDNFCFIPLVEYMETYLKEGETLDIYSKLNPSYNPKNFSEFLSQPEMKLQL